MSELRRGARDRRARGLVTELRQVAKVVWEPTEADWWAAGELVRTIGDDQGWETSKRREFQNDTLIALTARHHGAIVVTANTSDFQLLAAATKIKILETR